MRCPRRESWREIGLFLAKSLHLTISPIIRADACR
jgi:hypothetical protein